MSGYTMGKGWGWRLLSVAMLLGAMAICGCESEDTSQDITPTRFSVDRELRNYSATDEFTWDTTLTEPLATVRINDFQEGDTALRVYDGRGTLVLSAALNTLNSAYYDGNSLFFQQRTAKGVAGQWRVVLGYNDMTGDISLTME
jgi:hypothetical protein